MKVREVSNHARFFFFFPEHAFISHTLRKGKKTVHVTPFGESQLATHMAIFEDTLELSFDSHDSPTRAQLSLGRVHVSI